MNPNLKGVWQHMQDLGLGALAHANRHAAYAAIENHRWPELSVLQAAHAAELLIKARIAQEHPLLIFDQLPRSPRAPKTRLELQALFSQGRTFQWSELPDRLWAATGLSIPNEKKFNSFGKFRNGIQHFGPTVKADASYETLQFVFEVIDPFIHQCWGLYAVDYDEDYEPYLYFVNAMVSRQILFLVSPDAAAVFDDWNVEWPKVSPAYRKEMLARVKKAKQTAS